MQDESVIKPNKVAFVIKGKSGGNACLQVVNATDNLNTCHRLDAKVLNEMSVEAQQQIAQDIVAELDHFKGKQIVYLDNGAVGADPEIVKFFIAAGFIKDVTSSESTQRVRVTSPSDVVKGIADATFNPACELADLRETPWVAALSNKRFLDLFREKDFEKRFEFICGTALANRAVEIFRMSQTSKFLPDLVARYERQGEEGFVIRCLNTIPMGLIDKETNQLVAFCRMDDFENGMGHLGDTFVNEKIFNSRMLGTAYLYWCAMQSEALQLQKKFQVVTLIDPPNREKEFDEVYLCRRPNQPTDNKIILLRFQAATLCEESHKAKLIEQFYADKNKYPDPKPTRFEQLLFEQIRLLREMKPTAAASAVVKK